MEDPRKLKEILDTNWPWPLDGVQEWFEDFYDETVGKLTYLTNNFLRLVRNSFAFSWSDISSTYRDLLPDEYAWLAEWIGDFPYPYGQVFAMLSAGAARLYTTLRPIIEGIPGAVWNITPDWLKDGITFLHDMYKDIGDNVRAFFQDPVGTLQDLTVKTWEAAPGWVRDPLTWIMENAPVLKDEFEQFAQNLPEQISSLHEETREKIQLAFDGAFNAAADIIKEAIQAHAEALTGYMTNKEELLKGVWDYLKVWFFGPVGLAFNFDVDHMKSGKLSVAKSLSQDVVGEIQKALKWWGDHVSSFMHEKYNWVLSELQKVAEGLEKGDVNALILFLSTYISMALPIVFGISALGTKVLGSGIEVGEISRFVIDMLAPYEFAGALYSPIFEVFIRRPLEYHMNVIARPTLPSESDIKTWYLRGYIDEAKAKELLAKRGLRDEFIENEMRSWWVIPSISDLITFVVREVITPEDFYDWAAKQGLSNDWAKRYWEAHWVLPSFENLREAFWRGIISEDEYRKYIVWHDYKPEPRPGIRKSDQEIMAELSYKLPGKIDVRWMMRWGIIDFEEAKRLIKMEGFHPEWIDKIAEAEWLNQMLDERTRVLSQLRAQYRDGIISRDKFIEEVKKLRFTDHEIELIIKAADLEYKKKVEDERLKFYIDLFRRGVIPKSQFISDLVAFGWNRDKIEFLADILEQRATKLDIIDATKDERTAIRTTLIKLFKEGLITETELRDRLMDLGFSSIEIDLTVQRAQLEYRYDTYLDTLAMLKEAFRKDLITRDDFKEALIELGLSEERAELIVAREEYRKAPRGKPPVA